MKLVSCFWLVWLVGVEPFVIDPISQAALATTGVLGATTAGLLLPASMYSMYGLGCGNPLLGAGYGYGVPYPYRRTYPGLGYSGLGYGSGLYLGDDYDDYGLYSSGWW